jgi:PmbA protein
MSDSGEPQIQVAELAEGLAKNLRQRSLDGWEIYLLREQGLAVQAKEQKLESLERENSLALSLRVIRGGRLGFGYCSDFRPGSLNRLLEEVLSRAREADFDPDWNLPEPKEAAPAIPEILDCSFQARDEREKIRQAMVMEKEALDFDPRIRRVRGCEYQETLEEVWIVSSTGLTRQASATKFSALVNAVAEDGKEAQIASEFDWSFRYDMLDTRELGRTVARKALEKLGAKPVSSQKAPVIFTSEVAGEFLELLSYALNGENLVKNKSWLKGMLDAKIFSSQITIIDDGLFPQGPACFPFDGEGVAARKKFLTREGALREFIFDSYYARKMKTTSTANARRDLVEMPPLVGPSNLYLLPGSKSQERLALEIDSGMLVEEVLGMHLADEISGEYSLGVSGHWLCKGRIDRPVKGVAIAGNLKELFARVRDKGSDLKFYGDCASPSLLVEEMEISGS